MDDRRRLGDRRQLAAYERLDLFLDFCKQLCGHVFLAWACGAPSVQADFSAPEDGRDDASVNFDDIHLESFLGRLRQFVLPNEAFHIARLRVAVNEILGGDPDWEAFCQQVQRQLETPFPAQPCEAFRIDGKPVVSGRTFADLLEARLYTGAIHSERLVTSLSGSATSGWRGAHVFATATLNAAVGASSIRVAQAIMNTRRQVYRRWVANSRCPAYGQLSEFEELVNRESDREPYQQREF